MQTGQPSITALGAAILRAVHQSVDSGRIFTDPFARIILGADADTHINAASADLAQTPMRIFIAARSRIAEDALKIAVGRGVRQVVILGAGLDTFSLRNPHAQLGLRVFEVDHPATQAWKRVRLQETNVAIPPTLTFTPVDFTCQDIGQELASAGFRADQPAFFCWLGVVPYLHREAITSILGFVAGLPCSEIVFDYSEPLANYTPERRTNVAALAARTAGIGEPWLSYFDPAELAQELRERGFDELEDLGSADIATRYLGIPKADGAPEAGPHVMRARRTT
ncbi:MAG: SAM-dependent methyltransferase [bacterium]|nr:SAM-dependent methyltransferase [bacterium]